MRLNKGSFYAGKEKILKRCGNSVQYFTFYDLKSKR